MSLSSTAASHVDLAPLVAELEAEKALSEVRHIPARVKGPEKERAADAILRHASFIQTIRTQAKEVEAVQRQISAGLNRVHSTPASTVPSLVLSLASLFDDLRAKIAAVVAVVPEGQFWKVRGSKYSEVQMASNFTLPFPLLLTVQ